MKRAMLLILALLAFPVRAESAPLWIVVDSPGVEWHVGDTFRVGVGIFADAPTHGELHVALPAGLRLDVLESPAGACDVVAQRCLLDTGPGQPGVVFADLTVLPDAPIPSSGAIILTATDARGNQAEAQIAIRLTQPRTPELRATWEGRQVRVAWQSDAAWVCVYRYPRVGTNVLLNCYREGVGDLVLPWRDAAYKVAPGDRFCADFDYTTRVCSAVLPWRVWVPLVRRG